jgi:hypothetical protein
MKKFRFVSLMMVLSLAVAGAMTLLAVGCGGSVGGGEPSEVIDRTYAKSFDYKSLHADYDVKLSVSGDISSLSPELQGLLPMDLGVNGGADVDNSDKENPKVQATINLTGLEDIISAAASMSDSVGDAEAQATAGMVSSLLSNMEMKMIDKMLYLKMMGSWYEMNTADLSSQVSPDAGNVDTKCAEDAVKDKMKPSQVLTNIEKVGSEKIDDKDTTHYKAGVDVAKFADASIDVSKQCGQEQAAGNVEEVKDQLADMFKKLDVEMWIDGDDNLRQLKIDMELNPAGLSQMGTSLLDKDQVKALEDLNIALTVTVTASRFNEDVDISAPENPLKLEDLLGGFGSGLGGGLGGSSSSGGLGLGSSTTTNPFST